MIDQYTKHGVLKPIQVDETRFDINKPVQGTSVQGLTQLGQSNGLNAAKWWPFYVMAADSAP
ncbi:hypothetical protein [Ruegeria profundi]|uniref:hypothetical protein n=1 Tax=Ruegeria profundi TaxID=1685378 RepID=UPI001CD66F43|nr:hypothetical protein [Ruegeria profundi]MCA0927152.1 hypothetical protein [Ruegeria profundi]